MFRIDWSNPKVTLAEVEQVVSPNLPGIYDGLYTDDLYLYVSTLEPMSVEQEEIIKNIIYNLNQIPNNVTIISQPDPTPFAQPTYRTKRNATANILEVEPNNTGEISLYIAEERYIFGGCLIVYGAELGDYVTAAVIDRDNLIPVPYRDALCENHPIIAQYIEKEWVHSNPNGVTMHEINTYPLNAKITPGLYLDLHYHTTNSGTTRRVAINYYLTKKL